MRKLLSHLRKAVDDYNMIQEGDRIAVGVSGGKDSIVLMLALNELKRFYPKKFTLKAICLDLGFKADYQPLVDLCRDKNIELHMVKTQIGEIVFDVRKETNPCSLCAKMRRGALHEKAKELGCNKVALGHHYDDVLETFFLCLFNEARISCFSPVTYLDRTQLYLIRPLIYTEEREIKRFVSDNNLPVIFNPCPADGKTNRQDMKNYIVSLNRERHGIKEKIFHAIANSQIDGWRKENEG
ncbi:MAG: tRNA 2-thiocytidine(32) synthetase TtcA [Clostridia bacterium]|nr:tRNA 2-thiocytidine(32) synthetase TtcA [Clostridia bacterium]